MFFWHCEEYKIEPAGTCNVFTFSRSKIAWVSSQIEVNYWKYAEEDDGSSNDDDNNNQFDSFGGFKAKLKQSDDDDDVERVNWDICEQSSNIPDLFSNTSDTITLTGNECAIKFQVTNNNEEWGFNFKILFDSAVGLTVSGLSIIAAMSF